MKVVLSGYYGFDNVGDEAILFSIIQELRAQQPDIEITVLSNQPQSTRVVYGVEAVNRWKMREVRDAVAAADGLISGGGSLLQDETGMKTIPYYSAVIKLAKWLGKPVFVYAQGMGPFNKGFSRRLVKHVLQSVDGLTVRDHASKKLLEEVGIERGIDIVPDPVIGLSAESFESPWFDEQNISGKTLSVSVRDWPAESGYKERIAAALDRCAASGITVIFLPMHGKHDDRTSHEIAGMMKEKSLVASYATSIQEKIAIIGKTDVLVGMRLHALIFAAITNVPFAALSYDPKIDAFADIAGQPVAGHVAKTDWTADSLFGEIDRIFSSLEERKTILRENIAPLREKAGETAREALRVIEAYE